MVGLLGFTNSLEETEITIVALNTSIVKDTEIQATPRIFGILRRQKNYWLRLLSQGAQAS